MLLTELVSRIDAILDQHTTGDDELAHAEEDRLLGELLYEYAPTNITNQFDRMHEADWGKWYEEWYVLRNRGG